MARIPCYIHRRPSSGVEPDTSRWVLLFGDKDRELFRWLNENVGPMTSSGTRLPIKGKGWMIAAGYNGDKELDSYCYRELTPSYEPKGAFGMWLEIEDDNLAALLLLSGVMDDRPASARFY